MPTKIETDFSCWLFTDEELLQASVFTDMQRMYIQSELAMSAMRKQRIIIDPTVPNPELLYSLQHAEEAGYQNAMRFLLGMSADRKDALTLFYEEKRKSQEKETSTIKPA